MMTRWLHIDRDALAKGREPIVIRSFKDGAPVGEPIHALQADILGPSRFVFDPLHPLPPAGTYAWIETRAKVRCLKRPEPNQSHTHLCPKCAHRWSHKPEEASEDNVKAHTCPKCGTVEYKVLTSEPAKESRALLVILLASALLGGAYLLWSTRQKHSA